MENPPLQRHIDAPEKAPQGFSQEVYDSLVYSARYNITDFYAKTLESVLERYKPAN